MSPDSATKIVRIGGASGFWGDSSAGAVQLAQVPGIQYITSDYLAELTMSILAVARARNPDAGYATDFIELAMRQTLATCLERRIRIVTNAGGIHPQACARALEKLAAEAGLTVRVAVVDGDDIMSLLPEIRQEAVQDFYSGAPLPEKLVSANAYLGAVPIARALDAGADVVITGRVVDSALVLGILMHEFGWSATDYDLLAAGSLAGHIIECGCQATGGLFTDWEQVPDWAGIGYPVVECHADGRFVVTKPDATGGLVCRAAVAEQMLYEIGDPSAYALPDVICDFSRVEIRQIAAQRVEVSGARGKPPGDACKVSATWADGYRAVGTLTIIGIDAARKARRSGEAILTRTRAMFAAQGLADYSATRVDVLGGEADFGAHARAHDLREAVLRVAVRHPQKAALELFAREIAPAGTSWSPGTTGNLVAGRPSVSPLVRLFSFMIAKARVAPRMTIQGNTQEVAWASGAPCPVPAAPPAMQPQEMPNATPDAEAASDDIEVALIRIAWARSGDKGDTSNIGLIARTAELLPVLKREVTVETVRRHFAHLVRGTVTRYDVPGIHAVNFVLEHALDGGGMASLRNDPLGKGMAQILLTMTVRVPRGLLPQ